MLINMCKSKIHRAQVTDANLNYVGSITIDENLMIAANLREFEQVHVVNNNNGARFVTYVIKGDKNSGVICLNGAASRLAVPGDIIIILSYASLNEAELATFQPTVVYVDQHNRITSEKQAIEAIAKSRVPCMELI